MSTAAECKTAKQHRSISLVLFTIGTVILVFNVLILLLSLYTTGTVDLIADWLLTTGMLVVLIVIAIILLVVAAIMNVSTNKTLVTCILK